MRLKRHDGFVRHPHLRKSIIAQHSICSYPHRSILNTANYCPLIGEADLVIAGVSVRMSKTYESDYTSRTGKYLSDVERSDIARYLSQGKKVAWIAEQLGRHRSTIYREIERGSVEQVYTDHTHYMATRIVYSLDYAIRTSIERQARKGALPKLAYDPPLIQKIDKLMFENHWSPKTVVGRLEQQGELTTHVCFKTVYNMVNSGKLITHPQHLPRKGQQKKKEKDDANARAKRLNTNGTPIDKRPPEANDRSEFGHWEADTVCSGKGSLTRLFTLIERKTRYGIAVEIPCGKADVILEVLDQIEELFGEKVAEIIKTITFDNGSEFPRPEDIERSRSPTRRNAEGEGGRWKVYYAHPYSSWERGGNENFNGFLRRWIPKGCDIGEFTPDEVSSIVKWVNDYPREVLGWATASEAFKAELEALAA